MFKEESVLEEVVQNMNKQLKKNAESQNELIEAVNELDKAANLLDEIGLNSAADNLLEVLASIK